MAPQSGHGLPDLYGHMRTSTADRDRAIDVLKAAFAEGRLTKEEYEQRASRALASRTYAELARLTADLPAGPLGTLMPQLPAYPPYRPAPAYRPMNRLAVASLVCALMPGIPLLGVFVGLIAHGQIQERGERGAALATAGIIIGGVLSVVLMILVLRG